jgi:hypothetical protein
MQLVVVPTVVLQQVAAPPLSEHSMVKSQQDLAPEQTAPLAVQAPSVTQ